MAPQRDEIFKQKVNDCVQHIILQKFTNFHAIRSWNFRIFAMRCWPRFLRYPVYARAFVIGRCVCVCVCVSCECCNARMYCSQRTFTRQIMVRCMAYRIGIPSNPLAIYCLKFSFNRPIAYCFYTRKQSVFFSKQYGTVITSNKSKSKIQCLFSQK